MTTKEQKLLDDRSAVRGILQNTSDHKAKITAAKDLLKVDKLLREEQCLNVERFELK